MMEVVATTIPGCLLLRPQVFCDARGNFVKTFHEGLFRAAGLNTIWREEFYSVSTRGVLRGLHFQTPPHDQFKTVCCLRGTVLDAVVDLRAGSPTYGRFLLFELDDARPEIVYLSPGLAHGFHVLGDEALLSYKVSTLHVPEHDEGIHWASAGIPWPKGEKIVSSRDAAFPSLAGFVSPFLYGQEA